MSTANRAISVVKNESQREPSRESLLEMLQLLFTVSPEQFAEERQSEEHIAALVREFLLTTNINTEIDGGCLAEEFKDSDIPDNPCSVDVYLSQLAESVVTHSTHISSPRFIGHMTSALPYFVRTLGKLLIGMNQNLVKVETAKALSPYERQVLAMVHRLVYQQTDAFYTEHIQQHKSTLGVHVSGGTLANVSALWCARNSRFRRCDGFGGIDQDGFAAALSAYGFGGAAIIGSALIHYSFEKAADVLGLGLKGLIKVPVNTRGQIDLPALCQAIETCRSRKLCILAIVGNAGTTETGAIDPLADLADICRRAHTHFHVDAAWGGPLLFSHRYKFKLSGIELADSVTMDGHKQLYLPMGSGMVVFRDPHAAAAIEKHARYIVRTGSADLGCRSLEGSRPGTALFLQAALNIIGRRGYELLIEENLRKARYLAEAIRSHDEFELLTEPEMNILTYRYVPMRWRKQAAAGRLSREENQAISRVNERLQELQLRAGFSFVSRTTLAHTR
ncbi:MAG TPA: aminotransferase class V-fold PLP-dependent enzyme, partial [Pyrinomonadaceae bacterium]|nr:aminotransferase class V-fold PLP-dependent enzyme [Pyrinomonadaceae bacterium]